MRRREFIALIGAAGLPVATSAQNFERLWRIGYLELD
jgi:hypothetical protein